MHNDVAERTQQADAQSASRIGPPRLWRASGSDPLVRMMQAGVGPLDIEGLELSSPLLDALRSEQVNLSLPLRWHGRLIGLLNLGPAPDHDGLRTPAAVWVAELELDVPGSSPRGAQQDGPERRALLARAIEEALTPAELPALEGWQVAARFAPAADVGGDFYDFLPLSDGRLGILIGDATERGLESALVMAVVREVLRSPAALSPSPGGTLARANTLVRADASLQAYVTCFYAVLDPATGLLRCANAGHAPPLWHRASTLGEPLVELEVRGSPLGWFDDVTYEEVEITLAPGDALLLYSDGLSETRDRNGALLGIESLRAALSSGPADDPEALADAILSAAAQHRGSGAVQEDDISLVCLQRADATGGQSEGTGWRLLAALQAPSRPDGERALIARVERAIAGVRLSASQVENVRTAVSEAVMNAVEHGNHERPELPVTVRVLSGEGRLRIEVTDRGAWPFRAPDEPSLAAKLAGEQPARGWGRHLIAAMTDEMADSGDATHHTVRIEWEFEARSEEGYD